MADKPVLDYASGKPTAAQRRKRWLTMAGLAGGSIAAAAVSLVLAQPKPAPQIMGDMKPPPTTQPAMLPGKIAPPTTQPVALPGGPPPPCTQPAK